VNKAGWRQLAEDRVVDAKALLDARRWACAYYVAGYALECALKSCVLTYVDNSGIIFDDPKFLAGCRTHNLEDLLKLANLRAVFGVAVGVNPLLLANWGVAEGWTEESRYEQRSQQEAEGLYEAIVNIPNGVLPWIKLHW
jgi:hypothetical protein